MHRSDMIYQKQIYMIPHFAAERSVSVEQDKQDKQTEQEIEETLQPIRVELPSIYWFRSAVRERHVAGGGEVEDFLHHLPGGGGTR